MDLSPIAIVPAKTPGPKIKTSIKAQINEFTDLDDTIIKRPIVRTTMLGVVLRAVANATGTAITMARIVPIVAMFIVSQTGFHNLAIYDHFGGTMRALMSAAWFGASATKNQTVFSDIICQAYIITASPINQQTHLIHCSLDVRSRQVSIPLFVLAGITAPTF